MENTIRRSPPPRENEWTPTLNSTLRIRGNDPRRCRDEEPKELKFHQPPPPPPSPTYSSSSYTKAFCWNCKQNGYTINDCRELPPSTKENNLCTWCGQFGHYLQECQQYLQIDPILRYQQQAPQNTFPPFPTQNPPITTDHFPPLLAQQVPQNNEIRGRSMTYSQCGQKGHNRTSCNNTFNNVERDNRVYTYYHLKHYRKTCRKKNNNMRENVKEEERMNMIKEQLNMETTDKNWPDLVVAQ